MINGEKQVDWGMAETLAAMQRLLMTESVFVFLAKILAVVRAFFHRHSVLHSNQAARARADFLSREHSLVDKQGPFKCLTRYCQKKLCWHLSTAMQQPEEWPGARFGSTIWWLLRAVA